jgi:D-glycero-D-manno-heptose 1,7-bisphosphate phosphatase
MKNKAFFFDRDGIVNQRIFGGYVTKPEEFILHKQIPEILKFLHNHSYKLILITNQQGVGKGLMTLEELNSVHNYMQELILKNVGICFDEINFCTDLKSTNSFRRKPNPGMILESAQKCNIDLSKSFMIGDSETDIQAGKSAGVKTIFISEEIIQTTPDYQLNNIDELFELLLKLINGKN